eukprot:4624785-Pyramimonas_sp.AAC.1
MLVAQKQPSHYRARYSTVSRAGGDVDAGPCVSPIEVSKSGSPGRVGVCSSASVGSLPSLHSPAKWSL